MACTGPQVGSQTGLRHHWHMDDATRKHLTRMVLAEPTSSASLMAKVKAISAFADAGEPVPLGAIRRELEAVIATTLTTHTAQRAVSMALRLLAELDGHPHDVYPSAHPEDQADESYWHPDPSWRELDSEDTQGHRDHWRRQLGPDGPPWPRAD